MDSIIINLTYTQAPHSPLFPNPNCSKRNNETMNECMLLKSKTKKSKSTHTATCHLTETDVMFLHKRILLQQTSNTRNTRTLQETLKTSELKCQQLSGTRLVQIPRYRLQDDTKTRSSLATTFTHMSQTINLNQASLFTAIKLELIQTCPSTKIQSITASETCLKFLQPMIMIHRKSEDHLSPNMSDLTQVITYKQTCRRQKREMSTTLNYSYTVVKSAITCISNSDCSRTAKPPIAANTFTPHLHIEYTISRG